VTLRAAMRIMVRVGDLVQMTRDGQAQVGYSVAERSRGQVTLCVVRIVHEETRSAGFLVWPQKQCRRFLSVWPQKQCRRFLSVWPQNRCLRVFRFEPQNWQLWFSDFGLKITMMVSWLGHQNQVGYGLSVVPQNRLENEDGTGHTSRSSVSHRLEASRTRVFQSSLKTGGDAALMMYVVSSRRPRGDEAKDK
jgi:hypothetical protein